MLNILRWINLILIFLTLLSYLSPVADPVRFWPVAILAVIYPWLLLLNLLFIILWGSLKKAYFLFSLGCILLGWGHLSRFAGINLPSATPSDQIAVLTYNCHNLLDKNREHLPVEEDFLPQLILKYQPDIVCLQEFPWKKSEAEPYIQAITGSTPLVHFYQDNGGIVLFSRQKMTGRGSRYFPNHANGYQYAEVKLAGKKLRIYNIHLQTNAISNLADKVTAKGKLQEKETWLDIKGMIARYRRSAGIRAEQADEIAAHVRQSPYPVLLCGDLNDVPQSYAYHLLASGMKDGFRQKGFGLGTTFAGKLPGLRIDYILADPRFQFLDHQIHRAGPSDHYPVISRLEWKRETAKPLDIK